MYLLSVLGNACNAYSFAPLALIICRREVPYGLCNDQDGTAHFLLLHSMQPKKN